MLSEEQLRVLRHMLGLTHPERREQVPYRDHYCANPGETKLVELECLGMVRKYCEHGGYWCYCTTDAGRAAAIESALQKRLPKPKRLYHLYLDVSDCFPDLTFKDFLIDPEFADARSRA